MGFWNTVAAIFGTLWAIGFIGVGIDLYGTDDSGPYPTACILIGVGILVVVFIVWPWFHRRRT